MTQHNAQVVLETGYGSGINYRQDDYRRAAVSVRFAPLEEVYRQDYVLVMRYPSDAELALMRPDRCLMTMAHYSTRPERVADLRQRGLETISLDSIKDDVGRRLIENLHSVAWNVLEVGSHVVAAAIRCGDEAVRQRMVLPVVLI